MSEFYIYLYHIKTLIYQSVLMDSKDCDVLSTRRGILCAGAVKFMLRWHLYPLLCSSVPPTARCHQQLLLRNCTEHWQRALPLPAPPAADIHIAHCVPSVVVSNGGEWHWNKNKDVVMLPSCRSEKYEADHLKVSKRNFAEHNIQRRPPTASIIYLYQIDVAEIGCTVRNEDKHSA